MSRLPQGHALWQRRRRGGGAATSATPQIWPCWLSKGAAQGAPASGRACCHPHRSSPAIGTHRCLRNINRPLAASQANVRASKELLPLTPLCSLHRRAPSSGETHGSSPNRFSQQPRQRGQAPRSPGWEGSLRWPPVPPLTQARAASLPSCLNLLPGRG